MKRILFIFVFIFLFISNAFADSQQTSAITAQDVINRVKYNLNAVNDPLLVTADMLDWINQGILDIASRTKCLQGSFEKALVADTSSYDISGDFNYLEITDVVYKDGNGFWNGMKMVSSENLNLGMPDYPNFWYENNVGSKVIIFPTMSDISAAPKIIIFYVSQPTAITAGNIDVTSIPLPSKYDQALIYYVSTKALERILRDSTNMYNKYLESAPIKGEKNK